MCSDEHCADASAPSLVGGVLMRHRHHLCAVVVMRVRACVLGVGRGPRPEPACGVAITVGNLSRCIVCAQDKNSWLQTSLEQVERQLDAARIAAASGSSAEPDGTAMGTALELSRGGSNGAGSPHSEERFLNGLQAKFEAQVRVPSVCLNSFAADGLPRVSVADAGCG